MSGRLYAFSTEILRDSQIPFIQASVLNNTIEAELNRNEEEHEKLTAYFEMNRSLNESQSRVEEKLNEFRSANEKLLRFQSATSNSLSTISFNLTKINDETREVVGIIETQVNNPNNRLTEKILTDLPFKSLAVKSNINVGIEVFTFFFYIRIFKLFWYFKQLLQNKEFARFESKTRNSGSYNKRSRTGRGH
jgi:hypothetical protein